MGDLFTKSEMVGERSELGVWNLCEGILRSLM